MTGRQYTARTLAPQRTLALPVSEIFGPTLQGEGPHAGLPVHFLRLGHCNLHCSWCDTPWTWDRTRYDLDTENPQAPIPEIVNTLAHLPPADAVVLTGGEPLIHHHRLPALLDAATVAGHWPWHVETNGTIGPPRWWRDRIAHTSVSPKIAQDDDPGDRRIKLGVLAAWAELAASVEWHSQVVFKFVCRNGADVEYAAMLAEELEIPHSSVWIMPEGTTVDQILTTQRTLVPAVLAHGFRLTTRLHTLLWPDEERGR